MKKHFKIYSATLLAFLMLLSSCAQDQFGSIRMVVGEREQEVSINDVECYNDPNNGINGMTCRIFVRNSTDIADNITFFIVDTVDIFNNKLGVPIGYRTDSLADIEATAFGDTKPVLFGSGATFTSMSNVVGGQVCANFTVILGEPAAYYEGKFCSSVRY